VERYAPFLDARGDKEIFGLCGALSKREPFAPAQCVAGEAEIPRRRRLALHLRQTDPRRGPG